MIRRVLVVCVGNICRSPMAEALLRTGLGADADITVSSAGIGALIGFPPAEHAVELMREDGLDISGHRARQLDKDLIAAADLILIMESAHKRAIDEIDSTARGKVQRLCEWRDQDIDDPYQQSREAFEEALKLIRQGVEDWLTRLRA
ncbi:MAG: low molecular weight protein-tyrosine-phosphatase [Woeseia sp.]